jgi:hypothetical protein
MLRILFPLVDTANASVRRMCTCARGVGTCVTASVRCEPQTHGNGSLFHVRHFPPSIMPWGPQNVSGNSSSRSSSGGGHWFELYSPSLDLSVIVIAGTVRR